MTAPLKSVPPTTVPLIGPTPAPELHTMTLNVRRRMEGRLVRKADRWSIRRPRLAALLQQERPTILGTQEALPDQASAIRDALGPTYRFVGHGRQAGARGEGCPLFYDTERLTLLGARQVALSDRPDAPGSTSWGAVIPRVAVYATFRDRVTGAELLVVNTHLDVFSARARVRAAETIRREIAAQARPAVVLGDLNAAPHTPPWDALTAETTLVDAWTTADARLSPEWATYGGYRDPRPGRRIDAILVSPAVPVPRIVINSRSFAGGWPSDHLPVQAVLRVPVTGADAGARDDG